MRISGDTLRMLFSDKPVHDADGFLVRNRMKIVSCLLLLIPTILIATYSLSVSLYSMDFGDVVTVLSNRIHGVKPVTYDDRILDELIFNNYFPRALCGIMVGATLAVGGAVMQSSLRNPLADPYTTGISSGALFGVTIAVILGISLFPDNPRLGQITNAFFFALIPTAVIVLFTVRRRTTPTAMILIGLGVMYMFSAATTMLKYSADPVHIAEIYEWGVGTLVGTGWEAVPILFASTSAIIIVFMVLNRRINVLSTGENMSVALGVNPQKTRLLILVVVSICTSTAVCFTGTIGFVGLVIPHIARMIVGSNLKYLIPASAVMGALLLVASDSVARVIGTSGLPVGVITALVGSPLFLYFLVKQRNSAWS